MKVIIAGGRDIKGERARRVVAEAIEASGFEITEVVSGGAAGIDIAGEEWADANGIPKTRFAPKYALYPPKLAPKYRNWEMARYADALIYVWDGLSGGTGNMVAAAATEGIKYHPYMLVDETLRAILGAVDA